jgi:DNA-binding NtrC family response regulator
LLINQMRCGTLSEILHILEHHSAVHYLSEKHSIPEAIEKYKPEILCFEFDYPHFEGLSELRNTKLRHPSIPVLMVTDLSSESLAIWAFRTHVWDYFVKPVSIDNFTASLETLIEVLEQSPYPKPRTLLKLPVFIPLEVRLKTWPSE